MYIVIYIRKLPRRFVAMAKYVFTLQCLRFKKKKNFTITVFIGNLYKAFVTISLSLCMLVCVNMLYDVISCEKKKKNKKERKENDVSIFLHLRTYRENCYLKKKKKKHHFYTNPKISIVATQLSNSLRRRVSYQATRLKNKKKNKYSCLIFDKEEKKGEGKKEKYIKNKSASPFCRSDFTAFRDDSKKARDTDTELRPRIVKN